jgi:hypothetical protein
LEVKIGYTISVSIKNSFRVIFTFCTSILKKKSFWTKSVSERIWWMKFSISGDFSVVKSP